MDESITRSAGAEHGQEMTPQRMENLSTELDRPSQQRTTLCNLARTERRLASLQGASRATSTRLYCRRTNQVFGLE
jgi:FO synthase